MKKMTPGVWFHYDHVFRQQPLQLETMDLLQIGEICLEPGFEIAGHPQLCHEISCVISGSGTFFQDGDSAAVSAGDLIITPSSGIHAIRADRGDSLSYAYMGFRFLHDKFPDPGLIAHFHCPHQQICRDHSDIYLHFRRCMDEFYRSAPGDRIITEACLLQIIAWTCRNLESPPDQPDYGDSRDPGHLVYRIRRHVDSQICTPLTVAGIADALGYSPCYLSHHFREKTGLTLQQYILSQKTEKAKHLIALNRYSFTEIAEKLCYPSLQAFSRAFRRETGLSPSGYLRSL